MISFYTLVTVHDGEIDVTIHPDKPAAYAHLRELHPKNRVNWEESDGDYNSDDDLCDWLADYKAIDVRVDNHTIE